MVKILAISDVHGQENENLFTYLDNNDMDILLILGDITNFGPLEFVETFINKLNKFNLDVFAIPGNCDPDGICDAIENVDVSIHNKFVEYDDVVIFGYGGSNETPFNTPGEVQDDKLYEDIHNLLDSYGGSSKFKILVTHAPPFGSGADIIESGDHVGSQGILKCIQEFKPDINLCGHVHEAKSITKIDSNTDVANPGMLKDNGAILIDIDEDLNYQMDIISLME